MNGPRMTKQQSLLSSAKLLHQSHRTPAAADAPSAPNASGRRRICEAVDWRIMDAGGPAHRAKRVIIVYCLWPIPLSTTTWLNDEY